MAETALAKLLCKLKVENEAQLLEDRIKQVEECIKDKECEMQACSDDYQRLNCLYEEKAQLERELEGLMDKWLRM